MTSSFVFVFALTLIILTILIVVFLILQLKSNGQIQKLAYPIYDYTVKKAQRKAQKIIQDAKESAKVMLVDAELQSVKIISEGKVETKDIRESYRRKIDELAKDVESSFTQHARGAEKIYSDYSETFQKQFEEKTKSVEKNMKDLSDQFTSVFSEIKEEGKLRISEQIDKEIKDIKEVVDAYKKSRLTLVDNQIVTLVEKTASIVLKKNMSLKDHADVIIKALSDAKQKNIFS